jgi:AAA domain
MSILYYMALPGIGGGSPAMRDAGAQLVPYRRYLTTAIESANQRALSICWRTPTAEEGKELDQRLDARYARSESNSRKNSQRRRLQGTPKSRPTGRWIVLEAPPGRPDEPEATFQAFLEARSVHQQPPEKRGKNYRWPRQAELQVCEFDQEMQALLLDQRPITIPPPEEKQDASAADPAYGMVGSWLFLKPNTWALECQKRAVDSLENTPHARLAPLIRLTAKSPNWELIDRKRLPEWSWAILKQEHDGTLRDGSLAQREFVERALASPDFTVLEGPPGSGKTTAICELIIQLVQQQKRVLLVASTHVAVDNVLERLLDWQDQSNDKPVLPVRVGEESSVTSENVRPWTLTRLRKTWRDEILDYLDHPKDGSPEGASARDVLAPALRAAADKTMSALDRLLLESANLVCGTTIGILQHPAIKAREVAMEPFDVLIVDEASKTTLTEFLVPALHAKQWVVVGDRRQLSPYVEEKDLTENLRTLMPPEQADFAMHAFLASEEFSPQRRQQTLIAVETPEQAEILAEELEERSVHAVNLDEPDLATLHGVENACPALLYADVVYGFPDTLQRWQRRLPADLATVVGNLQDMPDWKAHRRALKIKDRDPETWAHEVAWRLIRTYELRNSHSEVEKDKYDKEVDKLLPVSLDEDARDKLIKEIDNIKRVAMPSILELLQCGAGTMGWKQETGLTGGLPPQALEQRQVSLEFQHRMHPDISAFPRQAYYEEDGLLQDAAAMGEIRQWTYSRYKHRATWLNIAPARSHDSNRKNHGNANPAEAKAVIDELKAFSQWAQSAPKPVRDPQAALDVAVLTFYRGQEAELRKKLRELCKQPGHTRNFELGSRVRITLCTVDRFQGHEADLVLLSFVKSGTAGFLNSPNRLNVALTRARYQLVLIGHQNWMASERCHSETLQQLGKTELYPKHLGWEKT